MFACVSCVCGSSSVLPFSGVTPGYRYKYKSFCHYTPTIIVRHFFIRFLGGKALRVRLRAGAAACTRSSSGNRRRQQREGYAHLAQAPSKDDGPVRRTGARAIVRPLDPKQTCLAITR
jgi:hypothetical protein